jgi:hypothetical protein
MTLAEHQKYRFFFKCVADYRATYISIEKFVGQQRLVKIEACHVTFYFLWDDQVHLDGWIGLILYFKLRGSGTALLCVRHRP